MFLLIRVAACAAFALFAAGPALAQAPSDPPTFSHDIGPILWNNCASCHRPGQIAPFSLIDYRDAAPRARAIAAAVANRTMPPWLPDGEVAYEDARRLSDADIRRIEAWVRAGAPEGNRADLPPRPAWRDGWQLGTPDLIVEAPAAYMLRGGSADVFRNLVIPVPIEGARWVRGIEVDPGDARVVHHVSIAIDRTPASRRLDEADAEAGFSGAMFSESARSPESRALGWTPGMRASFERPGMAWRLEKRSDLVLLLHLMPAAVRGADPSREPVAIRPKVALYFADAPPTLVPVDFKLGSKAIDIPPGEARYTIEDRYTLPVDADVLSVYPHAHYLAREMRAFAAAPDGRTVPLLHIANWDFRWQDQYRFASPVSLPRGTVVTMQYSYDNSAANKRNPRRSPVRVGYGPQSSDEMGDLWIRFLPKNPADREVLARSYREHEIANDIALGERMIAAGRDVLRWRNALGAAYLENGRIDKASEHLIAALRLHPDDPEAHNNLGHALQLQQRHTEALEHFREAVRLAPENDLVHLNLANTLQELERVDEAIGEFERAIALNPSAADAHNNLGVALGARGQLDEAIRHFEAALELRPDYEDARKNLSLAREIKGGR